MRARTEHEGRIVSKFGGVAMADASNIIRSIDIFEGDERRDVMTVSGPGARDDGDIKVTDLLLEAHGLAAKRKSFKEPFHQVQERFLENGRQLGIAERITRSWLDEVGDELAQGEPIARVTSRGEWLQAKTIAAVTGLTFVDATEVIHLDRYNHIDYEHIAQALPKGDRYIVPAWYAEKTSPKLFGSRRETVVFSGRGGSDTSGAEVAFGIGAVLYEAWKDVDGICSANPKIVPDAHLIDVMSEQALREFGNKGAKVFHPDAVGKVPVSVRNIFHPEHQGTLILSERNESDVTDGIIGVASKHDFVAITIEQPGSNYHSGIGGAVLGAFDSMDASFDHVQTGQDTMTVLVHRDQIKGKEEELKRRILKGKGLHHSSIRERGDIGLVTVVGEGIAENGERTAITHTIFTALKENHIRTAGLGAPVDGISVYVAVNNSDIEKTVQVLHDAIFPSS